MTSRCPHCLGGTKDLPHALNCPERTLAKEPAAAEVREWWESFDECKARLFDSHHQRPLLPSEQYGRLYLLNQQGEIVLSFTAAIAAYDALKAERDHWKNKYGTYVDKWNEENALANRFKAETEKLKAEVERKSGQIKNEIILYDKLLQECNRLREKNSELEQKLTNNKESSNVVYNSRGLAPIDADSELAGRSDTSVESGETGIYHPVIKSIEEKAAAEGLATLMPRSHYGDWLTVACAIARYAFKRGQAECDELREDVAQLNAASDAQSKQYHADTSALRRELSEAKDKLAKESALSRLAIEIVYNERDEARAEVERLRENNKFLADYNERLCHDRDEVRDRYRVALERIAALKMYLDAKPHKAAEACNIASEALKETK